MIGRQTDYYSLCTVDYASKQIVNSVDSDRIVESASTIKSPIGAFALMKAKNSGHSGSHSFHIFNHEVPSRATTIFNSDDTLGHEPSIVRNRDGFVVPLETLIRINIVYSDAAATTKLIEYLGGKDKINKGFGKLGMPNTELLTDVIDFDEMTEPDLSPRIGTTTASDSANYYLNFIENLSEVIGNKVASDYLAVHALTNRVRMFSRDLEDLPERIAFQHKTGTIFNNFPDGSGQAVIADAGILSDTVTRKRLAVASFFASARPSLTGINTEFSKLNQFHLGINLDVPPTDTRRKSPLVLVS